MRHAFFFIFFFFFFFPANNYTYQSHSLGRVPMSLTFVWIKIAIAVIVAADSEKQYVAVKSHGLRASRHELSFQLKKIRKKYPKNLQN